MPDDPNDKKPDPTKGGEMSDAEKRKFPFAQVAQIFVGIIFFVFSGLALYHRSIEDFIWAGLAVFAFVVIAYIANQIYTKKLDVSREARIAIDAILAMAILAGFLSLTSRFFGWPLEWRNRDAQGHPNAPTPDAGLEPHRDASSGRHVPVSAKMLHDMIEHLSLECNPDQNQNAVTCGLSDDGTGNIARYFGMSATVTISLHSDKCNIDPSPLSPTDANSASGMFAGDFPFNCFSGEVGSVADISSDDLEVQYFFSGLPATDPAIAKLVKPGGHPFYLFGADILSLKIVRQSDF